MPFPANARSVAGPPESRQLSPSLELGARIAVMRTVFITLMLFLITANVAPGASLRMYLTGENHPSGLYHAGDQVILNIAVENPGHTMHLLKGNLHWMFRPGRGAVRILLATTPIRPTVLTGGQIVRISLPETVSRVGAYQLLWGRVVVPASMDVQPLRCIYTPASTPPGTASPWLEFLPQQVLQSHPRGFITSYVKETGIRHYLINAFPAGAKKRYLAAFNTSLATSIHRAGADLIPIFTLPDDGRHPAHWLNSKIIRTYLLPLIPACRAFVVRFSGPATPKAARTAKYFIPLLSRTLRALKSTALIFATPDVISSETGIPTLTGLLGGVALSNTARSIRLCRTLDRSDGALPVMILPVSQSPDRSDPGLFLAAAATYVPVLSGNNNFELHVLGPGKLFSIVHPHLPLLAAVFQQTYGSVALVAGLAVDNRNDQKWSSWNSQPPLMIQRAIWRQMVANGAAGWKQLRTMLPSAGQFPPGKLIVVDAEGMMATYNTRGNPVPSPYPGWQEIPLNGHVFFLTDPGKPTDLVATLRTARIKGLPIASVTADPKSVFNQQHTLVLQIRNARVGRLQGTVSVAVPPAISGHAPSGWQISQAVHFGPIHSGDVAKIVVKLKTPSLPNGWQRLVILRWHKWVEITPLRMLPAHSETEGSATATKPNVGPPLNNLARPQSQLPARSATKGKTGPLSAASPSTAPADNRSASAKSALQSTRPSQSNDIPIMPPVHHP